MPIPPTSGLYGLLPEGKHPATMEEIADIFVENAPFHVAERRVIFAALRVWTELMSKIIPSYRMWVDGGFATHKDWAAPSDVDVVVLVSSDDLNALDSDGQKLFESLLTRQVGGGNRQQPMGGLVDGFYVVRGDVDQTVYWKEFWSNVNDSRKARVDGVRKGFLEVQF